MNFSYLFKRRYPTIDELRSLPGYDYLISGYNTADRVLKVFDSIPANRKFWLLFKEFETTLSSTPTAVGNVSVYSFGEINNERDDTIKFINELGLTDQSNVCIDITGIIIPVALFMIKYLYSLGLKKIDIFYSEPLYYKYKENTAFSDDFNNVRQVHFYEGSHNPDASNDLLIIASGYDSSRITDVAGSKAEARKVQLFGLPSLQADMYQENILNAFKAESAVGADSFTDENSNLFAPANDPFVAAQVIKQFIDKENLKKPITNLYLSPLSTKPHSLGMALYYIWEYNNRNASIIYPLCEKYYWDNSRGTAGIMKYTIEFPTNR